VTVTQTVYASAYGRVIAIETCDAPLPLPILPFAWESVRPAGEVDRSYRVTPSNSGGFQLQIDGESSLDLPDIDRMGEHIEGDFHHWLATYTRGYLFVHAGCAAWRERGIIIPGRSHAGKTTLTRALVEAGATYYSDDYAVIDHDGSIWPFPRRLYVRPVTNDPPHRIDPIASNWPVGQRPIRAAVVAELKFDREQGWEVEQVTGGMGALSLLDNTVAARERPEDSLRLMSRMMDGAIAIKGTRDDAESTARRLLAMVDELSAFV
jgi:hypothetical protein